METNPKELSARFQALKLSDSEQLIVEDFINKPNEKFLSSDFLNSIDGQDGITERWKYNLRNDLIVVVEGFLPGPWSTSLGFLNIFHRAVLAEIHRG